MLQLYKNQVVTAAAKKQVEIRQLELDWYATNYWTLSQQGALLAGFTFGQITTPLPRDTPYMLECAYLLLTTLSMGMQLCVVVTTTFCCMWGPGLALRGPHGSQSVHKAVDHLRAEQSHVFTFFVAGLLTFYLSNLLLLWCYFEQWVAMVSCMVLSIFFFLIIYYTCLLTYQLRVTDEKAVFGKVEALRAYESIGDLDAQFGVVGNADENGGGGMGENLNDGGAATPFASLSSLSFTRLPHSQYIRPTSPFPSFSSPDLPPPHSRRGMRPSPPPPGGCLSDTSSYIGADEEGGGGGTGGAGRQPCMYHSPAAPANPTVASFFCPPAVEEDEVSSIADIGGNTRRQAQLEEMNISAARARGVHTEEHASHATPQGFWQTLFDVFS